MMHQARFPNETSTDLHRPTCIKMSASDSRVTSPLLTQPDGFWNGGFVVGLFGHRWTIQCAQIKDYRAGTLSLVKNLNLGARRQVKAMSAVFSARWMHRGSGISKTDVSISGRPMEQT